jgi:hypothetical protein
VLACVCDAEHQLYYIIVTVVDKAVIGGCCTGRTTSEKSYNQSYHEMRTWIFSISSHTACICDAEHQLYYIFDYGGRCTGRTEEPVEIAYNTSYHENALFLSQVEYSQSAHTFQIKS